MRIAPATWHSRLVSGSLLGALFLAALFLLSPLGVWLALLVVCALAMMEFYSLLDAAGIPNYRFFGLAAGLSLITATWLRYHVLDSAQAQDIEWVVFIIVIILVFIRQFWEIDSAQPLQTLAGTVLGILYVAFLLNYITRILMSWGGLDGRRLLIYLIFAVKFSDIGAYAVGSLVGRHKMFPRISPKKTWEGFAGGTLAGVLAGTGVFWYFAGDFSVLHLTLGQSLVLSVLLALTGTVGDLFESLMKRAAGVKDSGSFIKGMGGGLDVLDSLLFAAPLMYVYIQFVLHA